MSILGNDWFDSEITEEFLYELGFYKIRKGYYSHTFHSSVFENLFFCNYSAVNNNLYISRSSFSPYGKKYKVYNKEDFLGVLQDHMGKFGVKIIDNE